MLGKEMNQALLKSKLLVNQNQRKRKLSEFPSPNECDNTEVNNNLNECYIDDKDECEPSNEIREKIKKQEEFLSQIWERALANRIEEDTETLQLRVQKMKKVIEELPPKCKEIIIMNKIQGIKYKDIADQLGISVKTVESQMRTAFTKIREAFKEDNQLLFLLFK